MQDSTSILDTIMESKKSDASIRQPAEIVRLIAQQALDDREWDIIRQRYGLGEQGQTLDAIGKRLGITRERVRQIAKQAIGKLAGVRSDFPETRVLDSVLKELFEQYGGVREEQALLQDFFGDFYDNDQAAHLLFFLDHISDVVKKVQLKKAGWQLVGAPIDLHGGLESFVELYLKEQEHPVSIDVIHDHLNGHDGFVQWKERFNSSWPLEQTDWRRVIQSFLELSHRVAVNPFGEWGPVNSPFVRPRRMGDKIYLVLRRHNEPLHFHKITKFINDYSFDTKPAYSPTVHNELILDDRFVLVGRGIYALKEWGYQEGTVADVLMRILQQSQVPLSREELITAVLKERLVKEGTVVLVLNDKSRFDRLPDGRYTLIESLARSDEEVRDETRV